MIQFDLKNTRSTAITRYLQNGLLQTIIAVFFVAMPVVATLAIAEYFIPKDWRTAWPAMLAALSCAYCYVVYVRLIERRAPIEISYARSLRESAHGCALGVTISAFTLTILTLFGVFSVKGYGEWTTGFIPIPEMILVAVFEEILFRAILFRKLESAWGSVIGLILSSVIFVLAHAPNEGFNLLAILVTMAASIAFGAAFMLTRRLWLPIGMHFGWNTWFESIVSLPVSGHTSQGWVQGALVGPSWLTGENYGIEGSVVTLVTWTVTATLLIYYLNLRAKKSSFKAIL